MAEAPAADREREEWKQCAETLGIDWTLFEENLRLSPLERLRQHDECVRQVMEARERLGASHSL